MCCWARSSDNSRVGAHLSRLVRLTQVRAGDAHCDLRLAAAAEQVLRVGAPGGILPVAARLVAVPVAACRAGQHNVNFLNFLNRRRAGQSRQQVMHRLASIECLPIKSAKCFAVPWQRGVAA